MDVPAGTALWPLLAPLVARWAAIAPPELASAGQLDALDEALLAHLATHAEPLARWLEERPAAPADPAVPAVVDPVGALALTELRWLQSYNQFLDLGDSSRRVLQALGERARREVVAALRQPEAELGRALAQVSASHRQGLARLFASLQAALPGRAGAPSTEPGVGPVVRCAENSAELQLSLLGLEVRELRGPVLDLGCGEQALLVHHLRAAGVEAYGVDRAVTPGPFVEAVDWFAARLPKAHWGTVLSHQGLSHHFMFHHLRSGPQAARYARLYMDILHSVPPGGAFVYAPGLPFFEALLPAASYRVSRRPIAGVEAVGGVEPYACRVERLPGE